MTQYSDPARSPRPDVPRKISLSAAGAEQYAGWNVEYGNHTMPVDHPPAFTAEDRLLPETPMDIGPWGLGAEMMLPPRHVAAASLVLIVLCVAVLVLA
jgi:hypothetical protein